MGCTRDGHTRARRLCFAGNRSEEEQSECRRVAVEEEEEEKEEEDGDVSKVSERETKDEEDKIDSVVKSKLQGNEQLADTSRD